MPSRPVQDFDDFMEQERRAAARADAGVADWQSSVKKGDYFVKGSGAGIPVYGEILRNGRKGGQLQHYRFSRCYSAYCPEGEMGDIHVSTIEKVLSKDEFNAAKAKGWM